MSQQTWKAEVYSSPKWASSKPKTSKPSLVIEKALRPLEERKTEWSPSTLSRTVERSQPEQKAKTRYALEKEKEARPKSLSSKTSCARAPAKAAFKSNAPPKKKQASQRGSFKLKVCTAFLKPRDGRAWPTHKAKQVEAFKPPKAGRSAARWNSSMRRLPKTTRDSPSTWEAKAKPQANPLRNWNRLERLESPRKSQPNVQAKKWAWTRTLRRAMQIMKFSWELIVQKMNIMNRR